MIRLLHILVLGVLVSSSGCLEIRFPDSEPRPHDTTVTPASDREVVRRLVPTLRRELNHDREAAAFYATYYELLLQNVERGRYATLDELGRVTAEVPSIAGYPSITQTAAAADDDLTPPAGDASLERGSTGYQYLTTVLSRLRDACREASR